MEKALHEKREDISFIIDKLNDSLALFGHANRQIILTRKYLLKHELRLECAHLCNITIPFTDQLFGGDVSKSAKDIEDAAKIGNKMQYGSFRGNSFRGGRARFRGRFRVRSRGAMCERVYFQGAPAVDTKNIRARGGE